MSTLPDEVDVVVLGAGHNGMICGAYLAEAGLQVLVLEARPLIGGNTVTEELTLPGFAHDSCSSAHVLIQSNPLMADDELSLQAKWGLEYLHTDPAVVLPQVNGDTLVVHRDLDATADEIGRWSATDAAALRNLIAQWNGGLAAMHGRWSSALPLGDSPAARSYLELRGRSAWDVVHERFEHPVVRDMMIWLSMATIQDPRRPGTGVLPSSILAGRLRFGWSTPVGGSGALPAALHRLLVARGGAVACDAPVDRIDVAGGRAVAVRTADGRRVRARRAVVASTHLAKLPRMISGAEPGEDLTTAQQAWRPGLSVFAVHAALSGDLSYPGTGSESGRTGSESGRTGSESGGTGSDSVAAGSVAAGLGSTAGVAAQLDAFYRGEVDARDPWLLVVNQTVVDPSRAPAGKGTFKILTVAPWQLADGREWTAAKDEVADVFIDRVRARVRGLDVDDILAMRAESPVDVAAHNTHNLGGSCHGGEFHLPGGEVVAGWQRYDTSIEGLFLTGSTSHPGGSVSGRPGRNAARAVLRALSIDPSTVMGPN
ncbi:MAG TPA: NAD(P)/FAD-dependent oxidoreductase [Actinoplanes sp.]|nr:NAD(P)/FAD-dependent oxidoreductase [Actinoplanes sp.]